MAFLSRYLPGLIHTAKMAGKELISGISEKKPIGQIFKDIGLKSLEDLPVVGKIAKPIIERQQQRKIEGDLPRVPSSQQPVHMLSPDSIKHGMEMVKSFLPKFMPQDTHMKPTPLTPPEQVPDKVQTSLVPKKDVMSSDVEPNIKDLLGKLLSGKGAGTGGGGQKRRKTKRKPKKK